ncbi:hypothetical protein CC79DRAFT_861851 [Sarocladium strictum]
MLQCRLTWMREARPPYRCSPTHARQWSRMYGNACNALIACRLLGLVHLVTFSFWVFSYGVL